jgi:hypothetical protein
VTFSVAKALKRWSKSKRVSLVAHGPSDRLRLTEVDSYLAIDAKRAVTLCSGKVDLTPDQVTSWGEPGLTGHLFNRSCA